MKYPFTESDLQSAFDNWGANCGPTALAFALQRPLSEISGKIPGKRRLCDEIRRED
jgi:hypothetical protein